VDIIKGIRYNLKGLWLGIKTPKLLLLGFIRFAVVIFITIVSSGLILAYHQEILGLIWTRPESTWIIWLWHVISWLLSLILVGLAALLSYLVSQILFSVIIMDYMSRITERMVTGQVNEPERLSFLRLFSYLIKQEIPRTIIPVLLSLLFMILGFLTPLGPITALLTSCMAAIFLSWDNTDLLPARRLLPFRERFRLMSKTILFHLGFGILFLVPGLNILFLSFAPVGATLYYIEKYDVEEN
jgi:CysZ protein